MRAVVASFSTWSLRRAFMAFLATLGGLLVLAPPAPLDAGAAGGGQPPRAASCSDDCNRRASDCLDGCEEKFKTDDKGRVTCKFGCATDRQKCEKDCGG